jgi:hypothetical protein
MWCVVVCDLETSRMRRLWPTGGCCANKNYSKEMLCADYLSAEVALNFVYICNKVTFIVVAYSYVITSNMSIYTRNSPCLIMHHE